MAVPEPVFNVRIFKWIWSILFVMAIHGCDRENDKLPIPVLFTGKVVEVSQDGSVFTGLFRNVEADQVVEYGFLWSLEENTNLENSLKYALPLPFEQASHSYINNSSLQRDTTYYVTIYVRYQDNSIYYGNIVSFYSLGSLTPLIQNVIPSSACFGDTVVLQGRYFGVDTTDKRVFFGEDQATVLHASDSTIEVQVPFFTAENSYFTSNKVIIQVSRTGYTTASTDQFQLSPPRISSYSPVEGNSGTAITVTGYGFHPEFTEMAVGGYPCEIESVSSHQVQALLPLLFQDFEGPLIVTVAKRSSTAGTVKVFGPAINRVFPDTVFSNDELKLYGRNLAIESLMIEINDKAASIIAASNDSITVKVPGEICADVLTVNMVLGDESKAYPEHVRFRQPRDIIIQSTQNQLFNGEINVSGTYFPEVTNPTVRLNGLNAQYYYDFGGESSSINIQVPSSVIPENEWLRADIDFCPSTQLSFDSVFHIPPPVILNTSDTTYSFSSLTLSGENFNAFEDRNQIYLGGDYLETRRAQQQDMLSFYLPDELEPGNYPIKIITNGQESNSVNVEYVHRWNKLADLPEEMYFKPVLLLHDNELFMGGGDHNLSDNFYSYNLLTGSWGSRSPLPVSYGLSFTDATYGYVYGEGALYRYEFGSDQWTLLSQRQIDYTTGFLYDNKIFILTIGIQSSQYYYDLVENTWVEFSGYTGDAGNTRAFMHSVLGLDKAYIFHYWDIYILDLLDLSIIDTNEGQNFDDDKSPVGFEYNGEAYLYSNGWEIYDTQDFSRRNIGGPSGDLVNIIRDGDRVYFMNHNELWTFDLTLQ